MNAWSLINLLVFIQIATCRDFYLGMFRRNDFLVAQDVIYKAPAPFGYTTASYGRVFKCPITYFRVVDRLGMGRGPITTIVRGGLRKKFINVRIKSPYRLPVSVNIYVGCENKKPSTFRTTLTTTKLATTHATTKITAGDGDSDDDDNSDGKSDGTTDSNDETGDSKVTTTEDSTNPDAGGTTSVTTTADTTIGTTIIDTATTSAAADSTPSPE